MEEVSFVFSTSSLLHEPLTGTPSETYIRCLEAVQHKSRATLFSLVTGVEAIQAMSEHIIVSIFVDSNTSFEFSCQVGLIMPGSVEAMPYEWQWNFVSLLSYALPTLSYGFDSITSSMAKVASADAEQAYKFR